MAAWILLKLTSKHTTVLNEGQATFWSFWSGSHYLSGPESILNNSLSWRDPTPAAFLFFLASPKCWGEHLSSASDCTDERCSPQHFGGSMLHTQTQLAQHHLCVVCVCNMLPPKCWGEHLSSAVTAPVNTLGEAYYTHTTQRWCWASCVCVCNMLPPTCWGEHLSDVPFP